MKNGIARDKKGIIFNLPEVIIDSHCHGRDFDQAYKTTIEQTLMEAQSGSVSISAFMPNTSPALVTIDAASKYFKKIEVARKKLALPMQYLWFGVTDDNLIECETALRSKHVIGLKIYPLKKDGHSVTTGTIGVTKDESIINAMIATRDAGKVVAVHCDDPVVVAIEGNTINAEVSYVKKIIGLARMVPGVKVVICHVSSMRSAKAILAAQDEGLQIMLELAPHYLWFDRGETNRNPEIDPVFYYCFNNLREGIHREWLIENVLKSNRRLVMIGSDNAPHTTEEKLQKGFGGLPSNQEMVAVVCTLAKRHGISEERVAQLLSWNAADFLDIKVSRKLVPYRLVERIDDIQYNHGIVTNPWNGSRLLFPQKI